MSYYPVFQIFGLIINIGLLVFIFSRLMHTNVGRVFFLITLTMTVWIWGDLFMNIAPNTDVALTWTGLSNVGASFIGPALLWFVFSLAYQENTWTKWALRILTLTSIFFGIISVTTNLVALGTSKVYWGYFMLPGPLYFPLSIYVSVSSIVAVLLSIAALRHLTGLQKKQMVMFILAFSIPLVSGIFSEIVLPFLAINFPPLTTVFFSFSGLVIAFAIAKYEFLTITPVSALQAVFDTMSDVVIAVDINGIIRLVNKSVTALLGYETSELIGKPLTFLFEQDLNQSQPVTQLLSQPWDNKSTEVIRKTDGQKVPVLVYGNQMKTPAGTLQGLVLVIHDMTNTQVLINHLKENTAELEQSRLDLEKKLHEIKEMNDMMVGREIKMVDLKKHIQDLEERLKQANIP